MVAAKLDQSGLLVTKFRQNRLKFKGRSAGQGHTHRQTDRQTDKQTRLKIRALQVCNQANRRTDARDHNTFRVVYDSREM